MGLGWAQRVKHVEEARKEIAMISRGQAIGEPWLSGEDSGISLYSRKEKLGKTLENSRW